MTPLHTVRLAVIVAVAAGTLLDAWALAIDAPACVVERSDGTQVNGTLDRLTAAGLELVGGDAVIPLDAIRSIDVGGRRDATNAWRARATLIDGSVIEGDDLAFSTEGATLARADERIALARTAVSTVEFAPEFAPRNPAAAEAAAAPPQAGWLEKRIAAGEAAAVADCVVVGSPESPEFVECAIVSVDPEFVTVVLDEETIRVKRSKVVGLTWLREKPAEPPRPAALVDVVGGRLQARAVLAIEGRLTVETVAAGPVRLPVTDLVRIDFGAVRTVSLVSLAPEKVGVEPWFGVLKSLEGLTTHFEPRAGSVAGEGGRSRPALLLRPRTVITWAIPQDGRTVRMSLAASNTQVLVALDDREVYRGSPTAEVPIDAAVEGARRLQVTVDFPSAGPGTGGPSGSEAWLVEPRIER